MSEQPPRPSGHLPLPPDAAPHRFDPDPEAPPMPEVRASAAAPIPEIRASAAAPPISGATGIHRPDAEERIRDGAGEALDRAADAARRLGHRVREQGGIAGRAEPIAYRAGDSLQTAAAYVREHDVESMKEDVELGVRAAPLKSLAIAAIGGFLLGRMLR